MSIVDKGASDVRSVAGVDPRWTTPDVVRSLPLPQARPSRVLIVLLVLGDALAVLTALLGWRLTASTPSELGVLATLPVLWVALMALTGWYARIPRMRPEPLLRNAVLLGVGGWALNEAAGQPLGPDSLAVVATIAALATRLNRRLLDVWTRYRGIPFPGRTRRAVAVGHAGSARQLMEDIARSRDGDLTVCGVCMLDDEDADDAGLPAGLPVAAELEHLLALVGFTGADTVIVLPCSHLDARTLRRIGWELEAEGTHLLLAPALTLVSAGRTGVTAAGGLPMISVHHARLRGPGRVAKEVWERTAAALALMVLAPTLAALMLAVRLDSSGPAIFRQTRVGKADRLFPMWKLRTMTVDAEQRRHELHHDNEVDGNLFKIRQDPRVTRMGRFLRRTSLDELPQLVNVVRGHMSLVGPRPALPAEVAAYESEVRRRLVVKPGITGLWQVSGRSDLSWEETVRLDQSYVDNWSLRLDLAILVRTVRAVLGQKGAY